MIAKSAPISAQPRAASIPIPLGPEAPVTTTTFPLRENISARESVFGIPIGMLKDVDVVKVWIEQDERLGLMNWDVNWLVKEKGEGGFTYIYRRERRGKRRLWIAPLMCLT